VKTMLAIVCSLLLAGTPVLVQASAACVGRVAHACHCGRACCAAPVSPESQPVPATPVLPLPQNQLLTLAPAALIWTLPETPAPEFSVSAVSSPLTVNHTPLYAQQCAFLI